MPPYPSNLTSMVFICKLSLMHDKLNLMYCNFFLQWNWQTIVIGVAFLCFLLLAKYIVRISLAIVTWGKFIYKLFFLFLSLALEELLCLRSQGKKNKNLFWVPAIAPLISVILSTFFVYITHVDQKGVAIVRISLITLFPN